MRRLLLAFALALLGAPVMAGQVPNPVNAPASVAHSGDALAASGGNPQQAADSGISLTSESQNTVLAGPASGGSGAPTFRMLTGADMPSSGAGSGSVTSVGLTMPSQFTCSGSPITASGALSCAWNAQSANTFLSGPSSGSAAAPAFRALTSADMPASGAGAGSVTSIGLSLPAIFTVSGSPITSSGTLTATLASQSPNLVFASPVSGSGAPTFRGLDAADLPASAPGLTAGTVTTNANLTGPITSSGNATAIASQTGTGSTFVMSASPTITGTSTLSPAANTSAVLVTGYSLTGSNTQPLASYTGVLNTSGVVDITAIHLTDTAHGSGSTFLHFYGGAGGSTDELEVYTNGLILFQGGQGWGWIADGNSTGCYRRTTYKITCENNYTISLELGGGGTVAMPNLPTSDPHVTGQLWSNGGVVTVDP